MSDSLLETVEGPLRGLAGQAWKWIAAIGVVAVGVGVAAVAWPGRTAIVVAALFAIYLLFSGVFNVILGLSMPMSGLSRVMVLLSGVLSVILGVMCFRSRADAVSLLGIWVGIGWLMSGFGRLIAGFSPNFPGRGWAVLDGIVSIVGGLVLLAFPISSLVTLVMVGGIFLIVMGVVEVVHAFQVRKYAGT